MAVAQVRRRDYSRYSLTVALLFRRRSYVKKRCCRMVHSLPRLAQLILLLIPGVNWVIEILVRWSSFIHTKSVLALIFAILVTFFGFGFGWLDLLWCLLFKHMICAKG